MAGPVDRKVFAGARIRRVRHDMGLTQARMAEDLGISASYLNLIERNQRPLSAQLLLRLAEVFDIDIRSLAGDEEGRTLAALREVFADPLFEGAEPPAAELTELADGAPAVAQALVALYRAYRDSVSRAADMAQHLADADGTHAAVPTPGTLRFPVEEVRDFFNDHSNHFPELEAAAETLWADAFDPAEDLGSQLRAHLREAHHVNVSVVPVHVMPGVMRRFDRHRRRLFLSELLGQAGRLFQMAFQIALLGHAPAIDCIVARSGLSGDESRRLCRHGLANYLAAAVMMPYTRFHRAAEDLRYDIDILSRRFGATFEQVCHRLTTLQRPGQKGVPFFLLRLDQAGNISKRFSAGGFHFARTGGTCPKWNVHEAFNVPGRIFTQTVALPDGATYFTLARTVGGPGTGYRQRDQQLAIGLGCPIDHARRLIYADGYSLDSGAAATPIGTTCRLCERMDCSQRAHPPLNRRLVIDDFQRDIAPLAFLVE